MRFMRSTKPLVRGDRTFVVRCLMPSTAREQLVRVALGLAAEFAAVVGEDGADSDAEVLVEGQHAIVQQVAGRELPRGGTQGCDGAAGEGQDRQAGQRRSGQEQPTADHAELAPLPRQ
jgi:hypothetical protein